MHVIVVGCGRVGANVAHQFVEGGHDVVVIDRSEEPLLRLGPDFRGRVLRGIGFDRDVLLTAGITAESAVLAVTSGDNSNILIARVARETFGVQRVVARIYDPRRAVVYERLGIPTVASVAWASSRVIHAVLPNSGAVEWTDPSSQFVLVERRVDAHSAGLAIEALEQAGRRVCLVARNGRTEPPARTALLQENDVIHVLVPIDSVDELDALLAGRTDGALA